VRRGLASALAGVVLVGGAMAAPGCSLLAVRVGPPPQHCERQFPVTDAVIALGATALALVASAASVESDCDDQPFANCFATTSGRNATVGTLALGGLVSGGSAVYGGIAVSRCPAPGVPTRF
jgi:hypothetical protein